MLRAAVTRVTVLCATVLYTAVACMATVAWGQEPPVEPNAPVQPAMPAGPTVTVHGAVTNAATGAPLARALVMVFGPIMRGALTDGEGRFELSAVPQGYATFTVRKPGYGPTTDSDEEMMPFQVHVAENMQELNFSLSPKNAISGHVMLSSGLPAQGVWVSLLRRVIENGRPVWVRVDGRNAAPDGSFRFGGLHDGTYMVQSRPEFENEGASAPNCAAEAPAEMTGYPAVFSTGSAEMSEAAQIRVSAGQNAEISLGLTQTRFHRVRIAIAEKAGAGWDQNQVLMDGNGQDLEYPVRAEKGEMCVYLPDGAYTLMVQAQRRVEVAQISDGFRRAFPAAQHGDLASVLEFNVDGKEANLRMALTQAGSTPVHVHFSPGPPPAAATAGPGSGPGPAGDVGGGRGSELMFLSATRVTGIGVSSEGAQAVSEMEYELGQVAPGQYWITAVPEREGTCLGAVTAGGQALGRMPWVARETGTGMPIDVELRTDCAKLTVELPAVPESGNVNQDGMIYVYTVPESEPGQSPNEGQPARLFGSGSLTMTNMTPGKYRVYAFRSQKQVEVNNPAAMEKLGAGQEVTLDPNGTATVMLESVQP